MEGQALPNATGAPDAVTSFGDFRLYPGRHLLVRDQDPVPIGSRALDILIALTERPGELLTKDELIARAWPNTIVEESNLRAQIAVLRRALSEEQSAARYIAAVPARGYRFIAPISRSELPNRAAADAAPNNLPRQLTRLIGREEAIEILEGRVQRSRLISIVGPGGIGKTTIGIRVAEELSSSYEHGVCFLDLAPLRDSSSLSSVLASQLRLSEITGDTVSLLTAHLRDKRMLLVFDSCELVVDAVAGLAEILLGRLRVSPFWLPAERHCGWRVRASTGFPPSICPRLARALRRPMPWDFPPSAFLSTGQIRPEASMPSMTTRLRSSPTYVVSSTGSPWQSSSPPVGSRRLAHAE